MSTQDPRDCMHLNVIEGTTVRRCLECGERWERYETVADALAACRAVLGAAKVIASAEREDEG